MRIESSVTAITWIPSEAVEGMPKLPFEAGIAHYDDPPPDVVESLDRLQREDAFREANELRAWIEVKDGRIVDHGYDGRGLLGVTRLKLGPGRVAFPAVSLPLLQEEPEVGDDWVRFVQTAGGRMGLPAPRRVRGKPYFQVASATAWTTLQLVIYANGQSRGTLVGASPFPRHWVYDHEGRLSEKSATIDFEQWYRESFGQRTPWGGEDTPAFVTAVETELERALAGSVMEGGRKLPRRRLGEGEALVEQGETGDDLFLLLDGVLDVEVDDVVVGQVGPGAIVGELAGLGGGLRTATLRAATPARVVAIGRDQISEYERRELADQRRLWDG